MAVRIYCGVLVCFFALFLSACGSSGFKILKNPKPDAEGFLSKDMLQIASFGFPSRNSAQAPAAQRQRESYQAAEIHARMRVIDFLMTELQNDNAALYQDVMIRTGGRFPIERYEDSHLNPELVQGGQRADEYFSLFSISGYVHTNTYNQASGRTTMLYRVVKADLVDHGKNGFGIGR